MSFGVKCRKRILHLDYIKVKIFNKEIKIWVLSWSYNIYHGDPKWFLHHWIIFNLREKVHNNVFFLPSFRPPFLISPFPFLSPSIPPFPPSLLFFFFLPFFLPSFSVPFPGGRGELPVSLTVKQWRGMHTQGLPEWCNGEESSSQCKTYRCGFDPWVGKTPWRRAWQPTPVFLPGESHGQRSLVDYSPWGHKELDTVEEI